MQPTKSNLGVLTLFLLGVAGAGALAYYVQAGHDKVPPEDRKPIAVATPIEKLPAKADQGGGTTVLVPSMVGMELSFKREQRQAPPGVDPMVFAVGEYLRQIPAVPKDARIVGVEVKDRTAILAFNHTFGDQTYGSEDEKTILDGLRATLGEFAEVDQILLQVDGKTLDSLGHVELNEALPVIRLSTTATSKPTEAPRSQASR